MGMLLSVPLFLAGLGFIVYALRHPLATELSDERHDAARSRDPPAHRGGRADAGRRIHGALPRRSAARLLHHARSARRARRFHHRAGNQPDVRRADRAVGRRGLAADGRAGKRADRRARARPRHHDAATRCAPPRWCRISARPRCCIWSRSARRCEAQQERTLDDSTMPMFWHRIARRRAGRARRSSSPTNSSTRCRSIRR